MEFKDKYDFGILVNEAERLVEEELGRRLEELSDPSICVCQDCVLDMAALALNSLKPVYRVSLLGTMYAHAMDGGAFMKEVKTAVDRAIQKVHANPAHD
jgi:competence protein ComFB